MILRLLVPLLISGLFAGCFERRCGPRQKYTHGYCVCEKGTTADEEFNCIKDAPVASAKDAGAMAGGCDETTGLGCTCKGDADCASFTANYCVLPDPNDPSGTRVCLFQGCDKPGKECPTEMQCCAFPFAPEKTVCLPNVVDNMDYKCPF